MKKNNNTSNNKIFDSLLKECNQSLTMYWSSNPAKESKFPREKKREGNGTGYDGWSDKMVNTVIDINQHLTNHQLSEFEMYTYDELSKKNGYKQRLMEKPGKVVIMKGDTLLTLKLYCLVNKIDTASFAVLNFANANTACGGYRKGESAQEEMLCLRSTLLKSLENAYQKLPSYECLIEKRSKKLHLHQVVFTPHVYIYESTINNTINLHPDIRECCLTSIISASSIDFRGTELHKDIKEDESYKKEFPEEWFKHIDNLWETIFMTAIQCNKKHIIIGPLGCGAMIDKTIQSFKTRSSYRHKIAGIVVAKIQKFKDHFSTIIYSDIDGLNWSTFTEEIKEIKGIEIDEKNIEVDNANEYLKLMGYQLTAVDKNRVFSPHFSESLNSRHNYAVPDQSFGFEDIMRCKDLKQFVKVYIYDNEDDRLLHPMSGDQLEWLKSFKESRISNVFKVYKYGFNLFVKDSKNYHLLVYVKESNTNEITEIKSKSLPKQPFPYFQYFQQPINPDDMQITLNEQDKFQGIADEHVVDIKNIGHSQIDPITIISTKGYPGLQKESIVIDLINKTLKEQCQKRFNYIIKWKEDIDKIENITDIKDIEDNLSEQNFPEQSVYLPIISRWQGLYKKYKKYQYDGQIQDMQSSLPELPHCCVFYYIYPNSITEGYLDSAAQYIETVNGKEKYKIKYIEIPSLTKKTLL
jgi:uncharacterized protein (TIGR02452 family)